MANTNTNSHLGYHINNIIGSAGMLLVGLGIHAAALGKGIIPLLDDIRLAYGAISIGTVLAVVWLFGFIKLIKKNKTAIEHSK